MEQVGGAEGTPRLRLGAVDGDRAVGDELSGLPFGLGQAGLDEQVHQVGALERRLVMFARGDLAEDLVSQIAPDSVLPNFPPSALVTRGAVKPKTVASAS